MAARPTGGIICLGEYEIDLKNEMKSGFTSVYKAVHKTSKKTAIVKKLPIRDENIGHHGLEEIKKFEKIERHVNIVQLYNFHYYEKAFWMIMEYCDLGNLKTYVEEKDPDMATKLRFMLESAEAIAHMHGQAQSMVHRDIKPDNILITNLNGTPVVKVADFGVSRLVSAEEAVQTAMFNTAAGTTGYMAPEIFEKTGYNYSVDVFSLGLVLLAVLQAKKGEDLIPQFADGSGKMNGIGLDMLMGASSNNPAKPLINTDPSDDAAVKNAKETVRKMVLYNPKERLTIVQVVAALQKHQARRPDRPKTGRPILDKLRRSGAGSEKSSAESSNVSPQGSAEASADGLGVQLIFDALKEHLPQLMEGLHLEGHEAPVASLMEIMQDVLGFNKFKIGQKVRIDVDIEKAKRLQKDYGGWIDRMKHYLGMEGVINKVLPRQTEVKFEDGRKWAFNPKLVHMLDDMPDVKPPYPNKRREKAVNVFKDNDIVRVIADKKRFQKLQEEVGLWKDWLADVAGLTGIVHKVDADGDVKVELITQKKVYLHADALQHVDQSTLEVEAGDLVFVKKDVEEVKRNQAGHGEWHPKMADLVGHATIVRKRAGDRAVLESDGHKWIFNVKSLMVVAKNRELLEAIVKKH